MKQSLSCAAIAVTPEITLYHTGPALDLGPLPSVFYFSLSGPDSLCRDPYNQPVQFLAGKMIRVFSLTLPAHEDPLSPEDALNCWAQDFANGRDCLKIFRDQVQMAVDFAIQKKFADPERIAAAGLSRGVLAAAFAAAENPRFRFLLGFAPLIKLGLAKEFSHLQHHPLLLAYDAIAIAAPLANRTIRFYIGNRDTRVSTKACFDFTMAVVEKAHLAHIRSPQVELIISPSVGRMGHGTSPEIFRQGVAWLEQNLTLQKSSQNLF
jgi:hypothetical protein